MEELKGPSDTFISTDKSVSYVIGNETFLDFLIDYPQIIAREKVSGEIYLNLSSNFPPGVIRLSSKGYEKAKIVVKNGKSHSINNTIYKLKEEIGRAHV